MSGATKMGGFKLSLAGAKNKNASTTSSAPLAKRPKLALGDDEVEDTVKSVEITGFDTAQGGAIDVHSKKKEEEKPRVIPALPNRNWRGEAKRRQERQQQAQKNGDGVEQYKEPEVIYGLNVVQKKAEAPEKMEADGEPEAPVDDGLTDEQRADKAALEALLSGKPSDQRTIPVQSEEDAFRHDYDEAPDAPDLDAYEATPIEGFGAALLRGMGWKEGDESGKKPTKPKEIKRRAALLGIGAKEEAAVGIELGEWGQANGKGKKKFDMSYNPVALRNKKTGEIITEEELKARMEQQQLVEEEEKYSSRKSKYRDDGDRKKEKKRRHEDEEDDRDHRRERKRRDESEYDSERRQKRRRDEGDYDSERRRDRDRREKYEYDSERRWDRKRRDDDDTDREGRHGRAKEKYDNYEDRRKDRREDDRRDRDRDSDRSGRRDRYRSRSRDSEYKRERRQKMRRDRSRSP